MADTENDTSKAPDEKLDKLLSKYGMSVLVCSAEVRPEGFGRNYEKLADERIKAKQAIIDYHDKKIGEAYGKGYNEGYGSGYDFGIESNEFLIKDAIKPIVKVYEKYEEVIVLGKEHRTGDKRVFIMSGHEVDKIEALYDLWQAIDATVKQFKDAIIKAREVINETDTKYIKELEQEIVDLKLEIKNLENRGDC